MHAADDVDDIDAADGRAEVANLVGERNHRCKQSIARVLDHLRCSVAGENAINAPKFLVQAAEPLDGSSIDTADNDAIRIEKVLNSLAFPQKFRIDPYAEITAGNFARVSGKKRDDDVIGRARHDRALDAHYVIGLAPPQRLTDLGARGSDLRQVNPPAVVRGADGHQRQVRSRDRFGEVRRRTQPGARVETQQIGNPSSWIGDEPWLI